MKRCNGRVRQFAIAAICMIGAGGAIAQIPVVGGPINIDEVIGQARLGAAKMKAAHAQQEGMSTSGEAVNIEMLGELIRIDERLTELLQLEREQSARSTQALMHNRNEERP